MNIPKCPLLSNYRKGRYALAVAYLFFFALNVVEYLFSDQTGQDMPLLQTITLMIAASQALLFTFAILALLEVQFPGWRYIFRETISVLLFIAIVFAVYTFSSEEFFTLAFFGFAGIYSIFLMRYTYLFLKSYRQFHFRMDNYYSDEEAKRLHWVFFSFFASLGIGVMALLSAIFISTLGALIFTFIFDIFYTFFAIRFINYTYQFHIIADAMDDREDAEKVNAELMDTKKLHLSPLVQNTIESNLKSWIDSKYFLQSYVTIDDVSHHIGTNNKYLSLYLNQYMNRTFREWINDLRIEEAKRLLIEYPNMSVRKISDSTGFSSSNYFCKLFLKSVGKTPLAWRKEKLQR
jgi:AraC-like DNA-binding protein